MTTQVAVIGAGVAGLNAARLLSASGVSVEVFEARERLGGRVLTVDGSAATSDDGYDLGASWFWPRVQPAIAELVDVLGIEAFAQNSTGDVVFERMSREPAGRYRGLPQEPESMRLRGGSAALVRALADRVPADRINLGATVTGLELTPGGVRLQVQDGSGTRSVDAQYILAALPPRLLAATMTFSPAIPAATAALWRGTPTWMASQAKFCALYETAFWRDAGLSGTAQSMVGPMLEIHDATTASGSAALFGFLGVGPVERVAIGEEALTDACVAQLARLFGPDATNPTATLFKDWAADPLTATADDPTSTGHPSHREPWVEGDWADRLVLAGSETSTREAGYLAGAAEASARAAATVRRRLTEGETA
ncbi:flavin monoamine oxidase family protein [Microbacterium sp. 22242]|uniref:flavin monoamine oxidase family protein n=1 Tax=Microbacterium sp. 22242 TaxID=3453896 RepID=UPI003F8794DC